MWLEFVENEGPRLFVVSASGRKLIGDLFIGSLPNRIHRYWNLKKEKMAE